MSIVEDDSNRRFKNNMAALQARLASARLAEANAAMAPAASAAPAAPTPVIPPVDPQAQADAERAGLVKKYMDKGYSENKAIFAAISQQEVDAIALTAAQRRRGIGAK